jgi:transposase
MGKPKGIEEEARTLLEQGKSYSQISELLGVSKSTLSYHFSKSGNEKKRVKTDAKGRRAEIRKHILALKAVTPCADCGIIYHYCVTQYDHLPQFVKKFNISQFHRFTLDLAVVLAEIAKCELVCANCHAIRGHNRRVEAKKRKEIYHDILDNDDWDYDDDDL